MHSEGVRESGKGNRDRIGDLGMEICVLGMGNRCRECGMEDANKSVLTSMAWNVLVRVLKIVESFLLTECENVRCSSRACVGYARTTALNLTPKPVAFPPASHQSVRCFPSVWMGSGFSVRWDKS